MVIVPNVDELYFKLICVNEIRQNDPVWGTLEVNVGDTVLSLKDQFKAHYLIKSGMGLWPINKSYFKTIDEWREGKLEELGI